MLSYEEMYDISNGIFLVFDKHLNIRKMSSNHSQEVRLKNKGIFPIKKFESKTRKQFILVMLYLMFTKKPPSFKSCIQELYNIDDEDVLKFKNDIQNYSIHIHKEVQELIIKYGYVTSDDLFTEYQNKNIKFYTLWFGLKHLEKKGDFNFEEALDSRIQGILLRKIQSMLLFLEFKTEKLEVIQNITKDKIKL